MSSRHTQDRVDIVVRLNAPDQLFNAPPVNPFSEKEIEVQGDSGIDYIVQQLQAHRRDWRNMHLVVQLPANHLSPGFDRQLTDALHRYCRARIARNALQTHLIRVNSIVVLGILMAIVLAMILTLYVLFSTILSGADQVIQFLIAGVVSLFAWVSLWDPLEAFLFNPLPRLKESAILRRIMALEVQVAPDLETHQAFSGEHSDRDVP